MGHADWVRSLAFSHWTPPHGQYPSLMFLQHITNNPEILPVVVLHLVLSGGGIYDLVCCVYTALLTFS